MQGTTGSRIIKWFFVPSLYLGEENDGFKRDFNQENRDLD